MVTKEAFLLIVVIAYNCRKLLYVIMLAMRNLILKTHKKVETIPGHFYLELIKRDILWSKCIIVGFF